MTIRNQLSLLAVTTCAPALGQTATLEITHNDPDGIVSPGETVGLSVRISWQGAVSFWEIAGDVRASPNVGAASNNRFGTPNPSVLPSQTVLNPGVAAGGSVLGAHIVAGQRPDGFQQMYYPWFSNQGFSLLAFDWTAPAEPGVVSFDWNPSASLPQTLFHLTWWWLDPPMPVPTTYLGTSLTVIPAPHAALALLAGLCTMTAARRRR